MLRIAHEGLTFDDVLLLPGYSEVTAKDVSLVTRLTRNIPLNIPLVSAAMDTVTEARLAIALAQEGGIGIIHKNMTVQEQAEEVRRVTIPTRLPASITGTPEIPLARVRSIKSAILAVLSIVMGSFTTPLSNFLTRRTSSACS